MRQLSQQSTDPSFYDDGDDEAKPELMQHLCSCPNTSWGRPICEERSEGGACRWEILCENRAAEEQRLKRIDEIFDAAPGTPEGEELDKLVREQEEAERVTHD